MSLASQLTDLRVSRAFASRMASEVPNVSVTRFDAPLKATGAARYTADFQPEGLVHAVLIGSAIARGRIIAIDVDAIAHWPGVLGVVSHINVAALRGGPPPAWPSTPEELLRRPDHGASLTFADTTIRYAGQPVAVVVADTLANATAAAHALRIQYAQEPPRVGINALASTAIAPQTGLIPGGEPAASERGNAAVAMSTAAVTIQATYTSPTAHHNPIEAPATVAQWLDGKLIVHDSNQGPHIVAAALAEAFGLSTQNVRVVSGFVGGAFGCKLQLWPHGYLAALAARLVARPVKLVLTRPQMFTATGHRPQVIQEMALGADAEGRLLAIRHDVLVQSGILNEYVEGCVGRTRTRYACPNVSVSTRLVHVNLPAGTSMRAPGKSTGSFALESAMDELASALGLDPIELRLRNFASEDPHSEKPWSSTSLRDCYKIGAAQFGWRAGGARRGGREGRLLIGHGMAAGNYPRYASMATARVVLHRSGTAVVEAGIAEIGAGATTVLPCIAAETLGLPVHRVELRFGDTELPFAPQAGGSRIVASVGRAILLACDDLNSKLATTTGLRPGVNDQTPLAILLRAGGELVEGFGTWSPSGSMPASVESNAAHFCEVVIDPDFGSIQVRRFVSAIDAGRVLIPFPHQNDLAM